MSQGLLFVDVVYSTPAKYQCTLTSVWQILGNRTVPKQRTKQPNAYSWPLMHFQLGRTKSTHSTVALSSVVFVLTTNLTLCTHVRSQSCMQSTTGTKCIAPRHGNYVHARCRRRPLCGSRMTMGALAMEVPGACNS